jgi:hypothetical protein
MNTKQILIGGLLIATALLTSCQQEALPVYSCDPEINKWANENAGEIKVMTRAQFLELDVNCQRAAFNVFSPQQRVNVWKEKLEETLILEWTASERKHIEYLLNMVVTNKEWYNNNRSQEVIDHIAIETYRWLDYAIETLQWDMETIYAVSYTPAAIIKNNGRLLVVTPQSEGGGSRGGACECSGYPEECLPLPLQRCNIAAACVPTQYGCHVGGTYGCWGLCVSIEEEDGDHNSSNPCGILECDICYPPKK